MSYLYSLITCEWRPYSKLNKQILFFKRFTAQIYVFAVRVCDYKNKKVVASRMKHKNVLIHLVLCIEGYYKYVIGRNTCWLFSLRGWQTNKGKKSLLILTSHTVRYTTNKVWDTYLLWLSLKWSIARKINLHEWKNMYFDYLDYMKDRAPWYSIL